VHPIDPALTAVGDDLHLHAEEGEERAEPEHTEALVLQRVEGAGEVGDARQRATSLSREGDS